MAVATAFVVVNRSRLESSIDQRQARSERCVRPQAPPGPCGVAHLVQLRKGDLLGLPFLAVGLGLFLLLVYKIGHPGGDDQRVSPLGGSPGDDALM
jgi:hypothetical protein